MRYNFTNLLDLSNVDEKGIVDVIAIVKDVGELSDNVSQKTNRPVIKRELTLVDDTGHQTRLTLWGNQAQSFSTTGSNPVIAFKGVTVSNFNGKSLSAFGGSSYKLNPEVDRAFMLRAWFDGQGHSMEFQSHTSEYSKTGTTRRMTFEEYKNETAALDPTQQVYAEIKGTIVQMSKSETFCYPACPTPNCNKKLVEDTSGGMWRCEKCLKVHPEPEYRYIMGVNVADHTGSNWLQAFNDVGEKITGRRASDLVAVK